MGKLTGIRVVDLTQFFPGPMLTVMMADQGAEVIKVEPPGGDPVRAMAPFAGDHSVWFANLNRGKASVTLDLKSDAGRAALTDLITTADVFVEGFRPGVMARLGFDYAAVRAINPRIVYASISAFGQSGPLAHHPAHDMAVQALAGFLSVNDGPDGTPVVPGAPSADMAAGLTALSAILMALIGREKTGEGDYVDIAMFDAMLPWCVHTAGGAIAGGDCPRPRPPSAASAGRPFTKCIAQRTPSTSSSAAASSNSRATCSPRSAAPTSSRSPRQKLAPRKPRSSQYLARNLRAAYTR